MADCPHCGDQHESIDRCPFRELDQTAPSGPSEDQILAAHYFLGPWFPPAAIGHDALASMF